MALLPLGGFTTHTWLIFYLDSWSIEAKLGCALLRAVGGIAPIEWTELSWRILAGIRLLAQAHHPRTCEHLRTEESYCRSLVTQSFSLLPVILAHSGSFWFILAHFFWLILAHSGSFWLLHWYRLRDTRTVSLLSFILLHRTLCRQYSLEFQSIHSHYTSDNAAFTRGIWLPQEIWKRHTGCSS